MAGAAGAGIPRRSSQQRSEALRQANVIRIARAQLRKDLAAGSVCIESVLADPPACARTAKVRDLLMSLQRFGPVRVARVLAKCRVSESKTLEGLSERQRAALLDHFRAT